MTVFAAAGAAFEGARLLQLTDFMQHGGLRAAAAGCSPSGCCAASHAAGYTRADLLCSRASRRADMRLWEHAACYVALNHCPNSRRPTCGHAHSATPLYTQMPVHCPAISAANSTDRCLQDQFTTFLTDGHSSFILVVMVRPLRPPGFCDTCIPLHLGPVCTLLDRMMPTSACSCACAQELWSCACLNKPLCPACFSAVCACAGMLSSCCVLLCSISVWAMSCCCECFILQVSFNGNPA